MIFVVLQLVFLLLWYTVAPLMPALLVVSPTLAIVGMWAVVVFVGVCRLRSRGSYSKHYRQR